MAITFDPVSPVDLGSVYTGASISRTVTISNSDTANTATVTATTDAGFSLKANSLTVPAATSSGGTVTKGSIEVSITFTPTAGVGYSGSFKCTDTASPPNVTTCQIQGTGLTGVTVSPSSLDFGGVDVGSRSQLTVSVTNATGQPLTLSVPSPFTVSPTTVAANSTDVSVTISFPPGAEQSYTGSLTTSGVVMCSLEGLGLSQADKYESEGDSTETPASPGGDPDTVGTKYYQIVVPNFGVVGATTTPGTSFLRMGSFPDLSQTAALPPGFPSSLTLANLVGDKTGIAAAETMQDLDPTAPANAITPSYEGDPNYLLGFNDDTRFRTSTDASWQSRSAETQRLLSKGGWWEHSDGNRISTTVGDRIDIVQGNYKLVVLGRPKAGVPAAPTASQLASLGAAALITDISGGLMSENGPSPTHCIKSIEFIQDESNNTWEVYQNNGIGKVYSSFYGDTVDIFLGQNKATWTGPVPAGYTVEEDDVTPVYNVYQKSLAIRAKLGESTNAGAPNVIDHIWANKILSYKGSSKNNVSTISDTIYVDTMTSSVNAGTVTTTVTTTGDVSATTTCGGSVSATVSASSGKVVNTTTGGAVDNVAAAKGTVANVNTAGGLVLNFTVAPTVASVTGGLDIFAINGAAAGIINLNASLAVWNIDLAPISGHFGVASAELATKKNIIAALVEIGEAPEEAELAEQIVAYLAKAAAIATEVVAGVVSLSVGAGEAGSPT